MRAAGVLRTVRDPVAAHEAAAGALAGPARAQANASAAQIAAFQGPTARSVGSLRPMEVLLGVVQVALSVVLIFLVLMHSGKDAGLSGAFGVGSGGSSVGGGSLVERNLNVWTVAVAIAFVLNTIVLLKI